jgi:hypothetical protein
MPSVTSRDQHLFTAEQYRAKAVECAEKLKHTNLDSERREFRNSHETSNGWRTISIRRYIRHGESYSALFLPVGEA